jgi:hypothetical protein
MEKLVHRWTLLALVSLLAGCREEVAPLEEATVAAQGAGPAGRALEGAVERVIPSLSNPVVAAALSSELKRLSNALEAGSAGESLALARAARERVEVYAWNTGADAAKLEAIRSALRTLQ